MSSLVKIINRLEKGFEEDEESHSKQVANFKHLSNTASSDVDKHLADILTIIEQDAIIRIVTVRVILNMIIKIDRRISKLERKSGITEERLHIDKELLEHLRSLQKDKERMEQLGKEMYG